MKFDIDKTQVLDFGTPETVIPSADTDGIGAGDETEYMNSQWREQYGAFVNVAEYQNALLMKGIWNTGKGWTASVRTTNLLSLYTGWGKDTFDDIIYNQDVMSMAAGDSFAQIIRTPNAKIPINLKPLNPGTIRTVVGRNGRLKRYEQVSRTPDKRVVKTFSPDDIFHLSYNRMADQIHGISIYNKLKPIIQADEKAFEIMQKIMAFQAVPFIIWKLKTDDDTTITAFVEKIRSVREKYGDLFIPDDENLITHEVVNLNPTPIIMGWRDDLRNKFYRALGLPQIVPGGGEKGTGSESRTIYLAFEQLVAQRQLYLQKQIKAQLGLDIKFYPPTQMQDLISGTEQKTNEFSAQNSEVNAGASRQ